MKPSDVQKGHSRARAYPPTRAEVDARLKRFSRCPARRRPTRLRLPHSCIGRGGFHQRPPGEGERSGMCFALAGQGGDAWRARADRRERCIASNDSLHQSEPRWFSSPVPAFQHRARPDRRMKNSPYLFLPRSVRLFLPRSVRCNLRRTRKLARGEPQCSGNRNFMATKQADHLWTSCRPLPSQSSLMTLLSRSALTAPMMLGNG
jgi:hypothetical protein